MEITWIRVYLFPVRILGTAWNLNPWFKKVFLSVSFSIASIKQEMRKSLKQSNSKCKLNFQKKNFDIYSNSYLVRQSYQGYLCKSDIAIFSWSVMNIDKR